MMKCEMFVVGNDLDASVGIRTSVDSGASAGDGVKELLEAQKEIKDYFRQLILNVSNPLASSLQKNCVT